MSLLLDTKFLDTTGIFHVATTILLELACAEDGMQGEVEFRDVHNIPRPGREAECAAHLERVVHVPLPQPEMRRSGIFDVICIPLQTSSSE